MEDKLNDKKQKEYLFDQEKARNNLKKYFETEKADLYSFGTTVNQVFEAYTFAETIQWYQKNHWQAKIINPPEGFTLKFSTRGRPFNYSYVICEKDIKKCQIRHQLRVKTKAHKQNNKYAANICCDIVIMEDMPIDYFSTKDAIENQWLIAFGEVKHMSAYAELIASFIGIVHELQPKRLKNIRTKKQSKMPHDHISSFLNVSGELWPTAKGLNETIEKRKYDIDVYCHSKKI
ncbi:MAG: hypothetical protein WCX97_04910 [Candidatus Magasanikbacteria bacterium]